MRILTSHKFWESLSDEQFLKAASFCGNSTLLDSFIEEMLKAGKPGLKVIGVSHVNNQRKCEYIIA